MPKFLKIPQKNRYRSQKARQAGTNTSSIGVKGGKVRSKQSPLIPKQIIEFDWKDELDRRTTVHEIKYRKSYFGKRTANSRAKEQPKRLP